MTRSMYDFIIGTLMVVSTLPPDQQKEVCHQLVVDLESLVR